MTIEIKRIRPCWRIRPGLGPELRTYGSGFVEGVTDLYSSALFGAARDFRCECGAIEGERFVGRFCQKCGVWVVADATKERRSRSGVLHLPLHVRHPLADDVFIDELLVAPIAFRLAPDGHPNPLGQKYERLVQVCHEVKATVPEKGSAEYCRLLPKLDATPVRDALNSLFGTIGGKPDWERLSRSADNCLIGLLTNLLLSFDPAACDVARSCACVLEVNATL